MYRRASELGTKDPEGSVRERRPHRPVNTSKVRRPRPSLQTGVLALYRSASKLQEMSLVVVPAERNPAELRVIAAALRLE